MRVCESQEWQKVSPLLYCYLASLPTPAFAAVSGVAVGKQADKSYFKFEEYRAIVAGHSQALNGLLTISTLLMPQTRELDDDRIRAVLNQACEIHFESEVTHFEECLRRDSESACSAFLVVVERRSPQIYIYESRALERCKEKASLNPRLLLKGHEAEVTALRCRHDDILSGSSNGEVRMHNLRHGENPVTYKYHREQVNDCCWLNAQEDSQFLSAAADGLVYMWDRRSSLPANKIEPRQGEVTCLEPVKDNCFLSGGRDGTVKLYDVRNSGSKFYAFKDHTAPVTTLKRLEGREGEAIYPHQTIFASGAANGEVFLWGEELEFAHLSHASEVRSIAYDRTTEMFATVEKKVPAICLWRPAIFDFQ